MQAEEDEERTRLAEEFRDIQGRIKIATRMVDVVRMANRAIEVLEAIMALDSDAQAAEDERAAAAEAESHYDSSTTTAPVVHVDEYDSVNVISDAEERRLAAIENLPDGVRQVAIGELLHPGDWNECFDVTWAFYWGSVALNLGWCRSVVRDIDPKGVRDNALSLSKSLTDPVQKERLMYELLRHQQAFARNMGLVIDEIEGVTR